MSPEPSRRAAVGPAIVAVAAALGAWRGHALDAGEAEMALVLGAVGLLAAWLVTGPTRVAVAALALGLCAAGSMHRALDGLEHHELAGSVAAADEVEIVGTVVGDPVAYRFSAHVLVRVDRFRVVGAAVASPEAGAWRRLSRTVVLAASGSETSALAVLEVGDRIAAQGLAAELEGPTARYRWRHAVAAVRGATVAWVEAPRGAFGVANRVRSVVDAGAARLGPVDGPLLYGFLLGDTRGVPVDVADDFRRAGLSHLLAVSGSNVAFVLALARPLTGRSPLGVRLCVGLGVVAFFVLLTRWEPSVLRASVMASAALGAGYIGRPAATSRLLAFAVVVLVLADPFLLYSAAFALSCAASVGIVALARPIESRLPGPAVVREPLAVSLAAQLGVAPVLIWLFGSVPALSPLVNMVAVPAAEPITVVGLPAALAVGALDGTTGPIGWLLMAPVGLLVAFVRACAALGSAVSIELGRAWAAAAMVPLAALGLARRRR